MQISALAKRSMMTLVILHCALLCVAQQTSNGFVAFWKNFRDAVIQNNFNALDSLTIFPLTVKGTLDTDPLKKISQKNFPAVFKNYLTQSNYNMSGTETDDIKTKVFNEEDYASMKQGLVRISDMMFKKIKGKWLMYLIYIETE